MPWMEWFRCWDYEKWIHTRTFLFQSEYSYLSNYLQGFELCFRYELFLNAMPSFGKLDARWVFNQKTGNLYFMYTIFCCQKSSSFIYFVRFIIPFYVWSMKVPMFHHFFQAKAKGGSWISNETWKANFICTWLINDHYCVGDFLNIAEEAQLPVEYQMAKIIPFIFLKINHNLGKV